MQADVHEAFPYATLSLLPPPPRLLLLLLLLHRVLRWLYIYSSARLYPRSSWPWHLTLRPPALFRLHIIPIILMHIPAVTESPLSHRTPVPDSLIVPHSTLARVSQTRLDGANLGAPSHRTSFPREIGSGHYNQKHLYHISRFNLYF